MREQFAHEFTGTVVALRLADDLLLPEFVAPLAEAPEVLNLPPDVQLLAYIGVDRAR